MCTEKVTVKADVYSDKKNRKQTNEQKTKHNPHTVTDYPGNNFQFPCLGSKQRVYNYSIKKPFIDYIHNILYLFSDIHSKRYRVFEYGYGGPSAKLTNKNDHNILMTFIHSIAVVFF